MYYCIKTVKITEIWPKTMVIFGILPSSEGSSCSRRVPVKPFPQKLCSAHYRSSFVYPHGQTCRRPFHPCKWRLFLFWNYKYRSVPLRFKCDICPDVGAERDAVPCVQQTSVTFNIHLFSTMFWLDPSLNFYQNKSWSSSMCLF